MKKKLSLTLLTFFMLSSFAYAGWSGLKSVWVSSTQDWTIYTVLASKKSSDSKEWDLRVTQKTMWSNPQIRLANSAGTKRSDELNGSIGTQTGAGNIGQSGYTYYAQIKPSSWQTGTDAIELEVNSR
jgi:hypothetical protein